MAAVTDNWRELFFAAVSEGIHVYEERSMWTSPWKKTDLPPNYSIDDFPKIGIIYDASGCMDDVKDEIVKVLKELQVSYCGQAEFWVVEVDETVRNGPYELLPDWKGFGKGTGKKANLDPAIDALGVIGWFNVLIIATDGNLASEPCLSPEAGAVILLYPQNHKSIAEYFLDTVEIIIRNYDQNDGG